MIKTKVSTQKETTFCIYYRMFVLFLIFCGNLVFSQIYSSSEDVIYGSEAIYIENFQKNIDAKANEIHCKGEAIVIKSFSAKPERESLPEQGNKSLSLIKKSRLETERIIKKVEEQQKNATEKFVFFPKIPNSDSFFSHSTHHISVCNFPNPQTQSVFLSTLSSSLESRNYKTANQNFGLAFFLYGKSLHYTFSVRPPPFS